MLTEQNKLKTFVQFNAGIVQKGEAGPERTIPGKQLTVPFGVLF